MYSTLIVLDKPRHLRYTFGVISDFEQAIPGGFMNVFNMEASGESGFRIIRDILYAGMKWEDPTLTIPDVGMILVNLGMVYSPLEVLGLWQKVFQALEYDEWLSLKPKSNEK